MRAVSAARFAASPNGGDPMSVAPVTSPETQGLQTLREPPRMRLLGLGEGLEPLRDLLESLATGRLGEARVHLGELVRLAVDRGLEVLLGRADRQSGHGIPRFLQEVEVPEGVSGLGFRGVAKEAADVRVAFDVRAPREIEVPAVRLRFAGKRVLQVVVRTGALESLGHRVPPSLVGSAPTNETGAPCQRRADERSKRWVASAR